MKRFIRCLILIVAASVLLGGLNIVFASGVAKVEICHTPPNGPGKYHTIKVSENALAAHLAHGDFLGTCSETCKLRCDDGNPCTIDACDPITGACLSEHPPVNCDDGDPCTADQCSTASGCLSAPISCDDSNACTANLCVNGECLFPEIDCGGSELCDPSVGCFDPCSGIACEPIDPCHEPGHCIYPGECIPGAPVFDGTPCDDLNSSTINDLCDAGVCVGEEPTWGACYNYLYSNYCLTDVPEDACTIVNGTFYPDNTCPEGSVTNIDCTGEPYGGQLYDTCGICGGDGTSCQP